MATRSAAHASLHGLRHVTTNQPVPATRERNVLTADRFLQYQSCCAVDGRSMTLSAFEPVRTSRPHPHQALDRGASCALSIERRRVDLIYHSVECRTVWQVESLITFGFEPLPDLILGTLPPLPMLVTSAAQYNPTPDALDESLKARVAMLTASREARGRDRCIEKRDMGLDRAPVWMRRHFTPYVLCSHHICRKPSKPGLRYSSSDTVVRVDTTTVSPRHCRVRFCRSSRKRRRSSANWATSSAMRTSTF